MALSTTKKPEEGRKPFLQGNSGPQVSSPPPCTLVFLDSSRNIVEGTSLDLETSYISMGRNLECLVSYGEEFPMVSRLHASIEWFNGRFSLIHLSETNHTLLNGKPVTGKWYLQDGDVIQLAPSGPKLKFKLPRLTVKVKRKKQEINQIATVVTVLLAVVLLVWLVFLVYGDDLPF